MQKSSLILKRWWFEAESKVWPIYFLWWSDSLFHVKVASFAAASMMLHHSESLANIEHNTKKPEQPETTIKVFCRRQSFHISFWNDEKKILMKVNIIQSKGLKCTEFLTNNEILQTTTRCEPIHQVTFTEFHAIIHSYNVFSSTSPIDKRFSRLRLPNVLKSFSLLFIL